MIYFFIEYPKSIRSLQSEPKTKWRMSIEWQWAHSIVRSCRIPPINQWNSCALIGQAPSTWVLNPCNGITLLFSNSWQPTWFRGKRREYDFRAYFQRDCPKGFLTAAPVHIGQNCYWLKPFYVPWRSTQSGRSYLLMMILRQRKILLHLFWDYYFTSHFREGFSLLFRIPHQWNQYWNDDMLLDKYFFDR